MRPADSRQGVRLTPDDITETAERLLAIMQRNPANGYTVNDLRVFVSGRAERVVAGLRLLATMGSIEEIPVNSRAMTIWRMKLCNQK